MMKKVWIGLGLGFLGMVALALLTAKPEGTVNPTLDEVMDLFEAIAFVEAEERLMPGGSVALRRWSGPVRVATLGPSPQPEEAEEPTWEKRVDAFLDIYNRLGRLEVSLAKTGVGFALESLETTAQQVQADLLVVTVPLAVTDEEVLESLGLDTAAHHAFPELGCAISGAAGAELTAPVALLIREGMPRAERNACFGETLALALGFHIPPETAAIMFRIKEKRLDFHPLGRVVADTLYHPDLSPTMTRQEVLDTARGLLAQRGFRQ